MILFNSNREYLFTKELAAHVVFAEVKHFAATGSIHGPSEAEVQSLTRRLSYLVDKDLKWTEIDQLVSFARELLTITAGTHPNLQGNAPDAGLCRGALLVETFWEINSVLGACRIRYEVAA
jgi:hypothetical protein